MKKLLTLSLVLFLSLLAGTSLLAQQDTLKRDNIEEEKVYKNTIRLNVTNPLIFGDKAIVLGYERLISEYQSLSINFGQAALREFNQEEFESDTSVMINGSSKDKGYNITVDYRFYLATENKHKAPRGIFIGPYASHVRVNREGAWDLSTQSFHGPVNTEVKFRMSSIGVELGYQFVLWKRVSLDFVLVGPGLAWYSLEANVDTDLSLEAQSVLFEEINGLLKNTFPGYSYVVDTIDFKKTGSAKSTNLGYRYAVHLGYRF